MNLFCALSRQFAVARTQQIIALCSCIGFLSACSMSSPRISSDGPGNDRRAQRASEVHVQNLPKSRYGNMESYRVFGKQYRVLDSAENFTERGVASWYGSKFHGRKTSSGEIYDMHKLTAAHKHLPLPTFARVTNLDNGMSVVVKINDRGPFVGKRVIDMSYAAAKRLDMTQAGTANVFVEALSTHHVAQADVQPTKHSSTQSAGPSIEVPTPVVQAVPKPAQAQKIENARKPETSYYIQLGAFKHEPNANTMVSDVATKIGKPAYVERDAVKAIFRVKMGPFESGDFLNNTISELASAGIDSYTTASGTK